MAYTGGVQAMRDRQAVLSSLQQCMRDSDMTKFLQIVSPDHKPVNDMANIVTRGPSNVAADIVNFLLQEMLKNRDTWSLGVPVLDLWIPEFRFHYLMEILQRLQRTVSSSHSSLLRSARDLMHRCVEKSNYNLALLLALIVCANDILSTSVTPVLVKFVHLNCSFIQAGLCFLTERSLYSEAVEFLKVYPEDQMKSPNALVDFLQPMNLADFKDLEGVVQACKEKGLTSWALLLAAYWMGSNHHIDLNPINDLNYVLEQLDVPQEQYVLDFLLQQAFFSGHSSLVQNMLQRFSFNEKRLSEYLHSTVSRGWYDVAEILFKLVDPKLCEDIGALFVALADETSENARKMMNLFITSGLSTVFRRKEGPRWSWVPFDCLIQEILTRSRKTNVSHVLKLMIDSGSFSHTSLHVALVAWCVGNGKGQLPEDLKVFDYNPQKRSLPRLPLDVESVEFSSGLNDGQRNAVKMIETAAYTPCGLKQLARLAVSDAVGTHPGRSERINLLPVPQSVKDLINFKDVILR